MEQVDRVVPYLGRLAPLAESLKRPKRILIVDVPIHLDDGTVAHFEATGSTTTPPAGPPRVGCASTPR